MSPIFLLLLLFSPNHVQSYMWDEYIDCSSSTQSPCGDNCNTFSGLIPTYPYYDKYQFCTGSESEGKYSIATCYFPNKPKTHDSYTLVLTVDCEVGQYCTDNADECPYGVDLCCLYPEKELISVWELEYCYNDCNGDPYLMTNIGRGDTNCLETETGSRVYECIDGKGLVEKQYTTTDCSGDYTEVIEQSSTCANGRKTLCSYEPSENFERSYYYDNLPNCNNEKTDGIEKIVYYGEECANTDCDDSKCCLDGSIWTKPKCVDNYFRVRVDYETEGCQGEGEYNYHYTKRYQDCYIDNDANIVYHTGTCSGKDSDDDDSDDDSYDGGYVSPSSSLCFFLHTKADAKSLIALRTFRDNVLSQSIFGRSVIRFYYNYFSPYLVTLMSRIQFLNDILTVLGRQVARIFRMLY